MKPAIERCRVRGCPWRRPSPFSAGGFPAHGKPMPKERPHSSRRRDRARARYPHAERMQKLIAALILGFSISPASAESGAALKLVQSIPLPGVDGRIDHLSVDVKGRRAFLAALA